MAEEELSPAQKLALASNFVLNSPPAQTSQIIDDVRTLVGEKVLTADKELGFLARVNKEKFAAVQVGNRQVLLTPHGELPDGLFLDPSEGCALIVDHKALTASKADEPLSAAQTTSMSAASAMRSAVDAEMQRYARDVLPNGVVTTYGSVQGPTRIVCCIAALSQDLPNYWAGRWTAEWILEVPSGGSVGQLTGKVSCNVHYFEDGNVQLEDKAVFQGEIAATPGEVGAAFASKVREYESGFSEKLDDIYQNMSDNVLQTLRRRLPVTRTKFDWDKLSVSRLASEVASLGTK